MRRFALLTALTLAWAPSTALAQTAPPTAPDHGDTDQHPATGAGDAAVAPPSTDATGDATAPAHTDDHPAVESAPVLPNETAAQATPATTHGTLATTTLGPHPTPVPENLDSRLTPIVELHGYFRTRLELFQNFDMGWGSVPAVAGSTPTTMTEMQYNQSRLPWFRNPDYSGQWCVTDPGGPAVNNIMSRANSCQNGTQISGNMRLRLDPEIHPTEFIAVHSQIDLLDNLVLGSTPEGYYGPWTQTGQRSMAAPLTFLSNTQSVPTAGFNSIGNSIQVRRAWAEVTSQTLGQLRVGRMPAHWGLGLLENAGNGFDSDYQTTKDRVMYAVRFRPLGLFVSAAYDFISTGATSFQPGQDPSQGQPHNLAFYDDVHEFMGSVGRRLDPEAQRAALARGETVFNFGAYFLYRTQFMSGEGQNSLTSGTSCTTNNASGMPMPTTMTGTCFGTSAYGGALVPRMANAYIPDLWFQILGRDFRIEAEAVYVGGNIYNTAWGNSSAGNRTIISQFGAALESEYRLLNQRLHLRFATGYASGDPDLEGLNYTNGDLQTVQRNPALTLFRFHPDYRIDLIYWRQIQQQIAGAYYFRPGAQYNFIDEPGGDLVFGRVDAIWSRASEFISTRGNHADLGVELDATLQYQSNHRRNDGTSDERPAPGFYAMAQYGIFLPLGGLGPTDAEHMSTMSNVNLSAAQTARVILGVLF